MSRKAMSSTVTLILVFAVGLIVLSVLSFMLMGGFEDLKSFAISLIEPLSGFMGG